MAKIFNIIIIAIIIIISGFFVVYPKYEEVMVLKDSVDQKKSEIYYKEERLANLEKLFSQLQQYKQKLDKIDAALPEEPSFPTLFAFLQRTVAENGLILENISFTPTARKKQDSAKKTELSDERKSASKEGMTGEAGGTESGSEIQDIYFSFNSTGTYDALKNFIFSLEKSSKIWEIISLSISSSDSDDTRGGETRGARVVMEEGEERGTTMSADFRIKTHSY